MRRPASDATRDRLLEAAEKLVLAKGFSGTRVDEICEAAKLTKGAFFHHFASKDDLALAIVEHWTEKANAEQMSAAWSALSDSRARFEGFLIHITALCRSPRRPFGCMVGVLAQELYQTHPDVRKACDKVFRQNEAQLAKLIDAVRQDHAPDAKADPRALARYFFAVFEGALILAKASGNRGAVAEHIEHFRRYVELTLGLERASA